jgi:hypothetical protein
MYDDGQLGRNVLWRNFLNSFNLFHENCVECEKTTRCYILEDRTAVSTLNPANYVP